MVAHQRGQGNGAEALIAKETAVLCLYLIKVSTVGSVILVDLVAQREQEAVVRAIREHLVYGLGPALDIGIQGAIVELWIAHRCKAKAIGIECRGFIGVLLGGLSANRNGVGVLCGGAQTAEIHVVDVIPGLGSLLHLCGIILAAKMQHCRIGIGIVPGNAQAVLRSADVNGQTVYRQLVACRLFGLCANGHALVLRLELHIRCRGYTSQHRNAGAYRQNRCQKLLHSVQIGHPFIFTLSKWNFGTTL